MKDEIQKNEGETINPSHEGEAITTAKAAETQTVVVVGEPETKVIGFTFIAAQRNKETKQIVAKLEIKFDLPVEQQFNTNLILGTALDQLFGEMDLHKACRSRLFDARLPMELAFKSEHTTVDLGSITRNSMIELKVNTGERSKLLFIDRAIILMNKALTPMHLKDAITLREDVAIAAQTKYTLSTKPKGLASPYQLKKISNVTLPELSKNTVDNKGEIKEEVTTVEQ